MTRRDEHGTSQAFSVSGGDSAASGGRGASGGGTGHRSGRGEDGADASHRSRAPGSDADLPADRLEHVIRRAAELQHAAGEGSPDTLSGDEVVRIGREVGLEPQHVRRALAEQRAESMLPDLPEDRLPLQWLGSGIVRGSRAVPGDRRGVQEKVEEHFRTRESLRAVRRRPGRSLWEPAGGLMSKMQRTLDVGGRGYELAEARSVELSVSQLEEGWSLVALTVDARNLRSQHGVNWVAGSSAVWLFGFAVLEMGLGLPAVLSGPLAAAGTAGSAAAGGRWSFGKKRRRLRLVVSGLLDRLEQGGDLEPDRPPGWQERLLSKGRRR